MEKHKYSTSTLLALENEVVELPLSLTMTLLKCAYDPK
jgi:hypothetical protein